MVVAILNRFSKKHLNSLVTLMITKKDAKFMLHDFIREIASFECLFGKKIDRSTEI